jgi:hypothetical protein
MAAERINLPAVVAERDALDDQDRLLAGDVVVTIGFTNAAVKDLAPREWEELAAYLFALLERQPMKSSAAFAGHRIVLGNLATELRGFAAAAGEPVGLQADLRAASSRAEELRIRKRIDSAELALDRHVDGVIDAHHAQREAQDAYIPPDPEEQPIDQAPAARQDTDDDPTAFL